MERILGLGSNLISVVVGKPVNLSEPSFFIYKMGKGKKIQFELLCISNIYFGYSGILIYFLVLNCIHC